MMDAMIGAVILAAGKSSRMGAFKPMLRLGEESAARRIVKTLKAGGAQAVLVVTGRQAEELRQHLMDLDVCFVHNEAYETSQMLDSVKLGLEQLKDSCSRILITPVDAPLFLEDTVRRLIGVKDDVAIPVCGGTDGHPVCISREAAGRILLYEGEKGLRGAMHNCGLPLLRMDVDDEGVLTDMDTPADYQRILEKMGEA